MPTPTYPPEPWSLVELSRGRNPEVAQVRAQLVSHGRSVLLVEYGPPHDQGAAAAALATLAPSLARALDDLQMRVRNLLPHLTLSLRGAADALAAACNDGDELLRAAGHYGPTLPAEPPQAAGSAAGAQRPQTRRQSLQIGGYDDDADDREARRGARGDRPQGGHDH